MNPELSCEGLADDGVAVLVHDGHGEGEARLVYVVGDYELPSHEDVNLGETGVLKLQKEGVRG